MAETCGRFLGRTPPQVSAMVVMEGERSKAELEVDLLSKYKRERTGQGLPRA